MIQIFSFLSVRITHTVLSWHCLHASVVSAECTLYGKCNRMQRERLVPLPKQRTHKVEPALDGRDTKEATRAMQKKATSTNTVQEQNISASRKRGYILKRICTVRPIPRISYFFPPPLDRRVHAKLRLTTDGERFKRPSTPHQLSLTRTCVYIPSDRKSVV